HASLASALPAFFSLHATHTPHFYSPSLHDALPISFTCPQLRHSDQFHRRDHRRRDHLHGPHGILGEPVRLWRRRPRQRTRGWRRLDGNSHAVLGTHSGADASAGNFSPARIRCRRNRRSDGWAALWFDQRTGETGRIHPAHSELVSAKQGGPVLREAAFRWRSRLSIRLAVQHAPSARRANRRPPGNAHPPPRLSEAETL